MAYDEKAVVKIDADGNLMKCAKGLGDSECGYSPGAKVCGKCGAMSVAMKMVPVEEKTAMMDDEDIMDDEDMPKKPTMKAGDEEGMDDEEDNLPEVVDEDEEEMPKGWGKKKPGMMMKAGDEEEMDDEEDTPEVEKNPAADAEEDMAEGEEDDEEEDMPSEKALASYRRNRLGALNVKSAELFETGFLCANDRKVYSESAGECDGCMGGCQGRYAGDAGLLEVEGMVEARFKGQVLDSGYSDIAGTYVVDLAKKDGKIIEVFVERDTLDVTGWVRLQDDTMYQKSLEDDISSFIDFDEAAEIAVKSVPGEIRAVEPDIFEGYDCYAVEIDGLDGKSYDVFVSLDGVEIGRDVYETDEAEEIEAEAAEIALKRAFTQDQRDAMAKEGTALPDGSFPIANREDLQNAIMAFGRAKDKEKAKAHIMKRAKDLGAESMIPEDWSAGEKSLEDGAFMQALAEFELLAEDETLDN
jgi:hypothetical protein